MILLSVCLWFIPDICPSSHHRCCSCLLNSSDLRGGGGFGDMGGGTAPPSSPSWCVPAARSQTGEHMCRCQCEQKLSGLYTRVLIRPEGWGGAPPPTRSSHSLLRRSEQRLSRDCCQVRTLFLGLSLSRSLPLSLSCSFIHTNSLWKQSMQTVKSFTFGALCCDLFALELMRCSASLMSICTNSKALWCFKHS